MSENEHQWIFTWRGAAGDTHVQALDNKQIPPLTGVPLCYFDRSAIMVHFSELEDLQLDE